jgi:hypothetical protein
MRKMEASGELLTRFVSRLFESPALRSLPLLQKEDQALQFLLANGPQLKPVFLSLGLDPSAGWESGVQVISQAVKQRVGAMLEAEIDSIVDQHITLSFFPAVFGGRQPPPRLRAELRALLRRSASHPVSRIALSGCLPAARSDLTGKYIPQAWARRKYLYLEVTRVQRLQLGADDLADLIRLTIMLRPAAYLFVTPAGVPDREAGFAPLQESFLQKALPSIGALLPSVPTPLIQLGVRSTLAFPATRTVEGVARASAILAFRGRSLVPGMVVDRGADTADKSWFNVARKNARWHGLDPSLLDELYTIAAENRW